MSSDYEKKRKPGNGNENKSKKLPVDISGMLPALIIVALAFVAALVLAGTRAGA